jgi:hypothetical protein
MRTNLQERRRRTKTKTKVAYGVFMKPFTAMSIIIEDVVPKNDYNNYIAFIS